MFWFSYICWQIHCYVCDEKIDTIEKMEEQSEMRNETFV